MGNLLMCISQLLMYAVAMVTMKSKVTFAVLNIQQLFSEIKVNSGRIFTDMQSMEVNILKVTIHRD